MRKIILFNKKPSVLLIEDKYIYELYFRYQFDRMGIKFDTCPSHFMAVLHKKWDVYPQWDLDSYNYIILDGVTTGMKHNYEWFIDNVSEDIVKKCIPFSAELTMNLDMIMLGADGGMFGKTNWLKIPKYIKRSINDID